MNKRKIRLLCTVSALTIAATAVVTTAWVKNKTLVFGGEPLYTMSLANAPKELGGDYANFSTTLKTNQNNDIAFTFNGAKESANNLCELNANGYIMNTTLLNGVENVTATFTGGLKVFGSVVDTESLDEIGTLTSGTLFTFPRSYDYVSFVATEATVVHDLTMEYSCTSRVSFDETKRYEAENVLVRTSDWNFDGTLIQDNRASNGQYIGNIWTGVTFHVSHYAPIAGERTVRIWYVNGASGQKMCYGVNGGKTMIDVPATDEGAWDFASLSYVDIQANLLQGNNDIVFGCTGAYAQYDYFEVLGSNARYDSAKLEMKSTRVMKYAIECEKIQNANHATDWNGSFFAQGGYGLTDTDGNGFLVTFNNVKAGNYNVKLVYGVDSKINVNLKVNNAKTYRSIELESSGAWNTLGNKTIQCTFVDGTNTLEIVRAGHWCNFNAIIATPKVS